MFKRNKRIICALISVLMLFANVNFVFAINTEPGVKNIIFMIPDGGGMAPFYLADKVKQAGGLSHISANVTPVEKGEMTIKPYLVGAETTHSANAAITDSAASGTALSSGYKTNNAMIGVSPDKKPHANILEACQELGKNTGLVATYEWSHATPAAFSAHAETRIDTMNIAEQIINQDIDVVLGNTNELYLEAEWFVDEAFEKLGYDVIKTKAQLENVKAGDRIWGKLPAAYYDIKREKDTPNLAELTEAAIKALDDGNENGFFLMVEGSAVDGGGEGSDAIDMTSEFLAFDEACRVAIEFAKKRNDTLIVIMPDHDTGGIIADNKYSIDALNTSAQNIMSGIQPQNIAWEGAGEHTDRNGGIFMYVPEGVEYPDGIDASRAAEVAAAFEADTRSCEINRVDNTAMASYLAGVIGVDLEILTDALFVDVTDLGKYDSETEVFTFSSYADKDISIKRNASYAEIDGSEVSLDGRISLYIDGRFYVPQVLIDAIEGKDSEKAFIVEKKYIVQTEKTEDTEKTEYTPSTSPTAADPSIQGHWAERALSKAVSDGLIKGSDKGLEPDRNVTKAELITMMMRAVGIENDQGQGPQWYSAAANKAVELGWTDYLSDIEADINRAASAGIIANAMQINGNSFDVKTFTDDAEISQAGYLDAVRDCVSLGIITGYPDGSFKPLNTITRAEAVVIIQRAFY